MRTWALLAVMGLHGGIMQGMSLHNNEMSGSDTVQEEWHTITLAFPPHWVTSGRVKSSTEKMQIPAGATIAEIKKMIKDAYYGVPISAQRISALYYVFSIAPIAHPRRMSPPLEDRVPLRECIKEFMSSSFQLNLA